MQCHADQEERRRRKVQPVFGRLGPPSFRRPLPAPPTTRRTLRQLPRGTLGAADVGVHGSGGRCTGGHVAPRARCRPGISCHVASCGAQPAARDPPSAWSLMYKRIWGWRDEKVDVVEIIPLVLLDEGATNRATSCGSWQRPWSQLAKKRGAARATGHGASVWHWEQRPQKVISAVCTAKPNVFDGVRQGLCPTTKSTSATLLQFRQTM